MPRQPLLQSAVSLMVLLAAAGVGAGQGLVLPYAGGMHGSMAGASTAQGADALGALYWNPATISGLERSEVVIGGIALYPNVHLGSTIPAGTFGPLPFETLSGETRSDSGLALFSGLGMVYKPEGSPLTYGLAMVTLAGGGVNFPGDPGNPILSPTGPFNNVVLGPQAAALTVASIMPTVSYQVTDDLAVGGGPMIDVSVVSFDPAFFTKPNDASGDGLFTFPTGSHTRPFWGGGFRLGTTYRVTPTLGVGFAFQSKQWFETWKFNAANEVGDPITFSTKFNLPTIISGGVAYSGIKDLLLNADVRWLDYANADLLGTSPRDGGAGWRSIWAIALGGRYQLTEQLSVQAGYLWNQNPIPNQFTLFNTMLPCITQHTVSLGGYFQLNEWVGFSAAYVHGFENSISGSPFELLGTSTNITSEYDALAFGLHIKFGPKGCGTCGTCSQPMGGEPMMMVPSQPTVGGVAQ